MSINLEKMFCSLSGLSVFWLSGKSEHKSLYIISREIKSFDLVFCRECDSMKTDD